MKTNLFSSRKLDYLRIILFIPMAWVAYNLSANLFVEISKKDLIMRLSINTWRYYGSEILLFLVFVMTGALVAPGIVRLWAGALSLLSYGIAAFWSIWILPSILDIIIKNMALNRLLNYSVMIIPMLLSIVVVMGKYRKTIGCSKTI